MTQPIRLSAFLKPAFAILASFALVFSLFGCSNSNQSNDESQDQANQTNETKEEKTSNSSEKGDGKTYANGDITIKDIKVVDTKFYGKAITCTAINNTVDILEGVEFNVTANYSVKDEFGDALEESSILDVFCIGMKEDHVASKVYLKPGDNSLEFLVDNKTGVVATYTAKKGDTQYITLQDCTDIEVSTTGGKLLGAHEYQFLDPDECDVSLKASSTSNNAGELYANITNTTDYRWAEVQIGVVSKDEKGRYISSVSSQKANTYDLAGAFVPADLLAEYVDVDKTVKTEPVEYFFDPENPREFEVTYVLVKKYIK